MANWAYIENGEIKETYDILPECWKNISNFYAINDINYLNSLNWFKITHLEYNYDSTKQKLDNLRYTIEGTTVTELYDIVDIPVESPTVTDIEKMLINHTQNYLDNFAKTGGYDNILTACSYANDPYQKYNIEGQYCLQIRSQTWQTLFEILDEIKSGTRDIPNSFEEIVNEFPELEWPENVSS